MKEIRTLSLSLAIICAVAALALTQVNALTRPAILAAEARAHRQAIEQVLPPFTSLLGDTLGPVEAPTHYFSGRDTSGLTGIAFTAVSSQGYSGDIEVMVGVDPSGKVSGVRVLRHAETPGLGANYAAPDVLKTLYVGFSLEDRDWRVTKDGGDVDAMTGATITGRAIAEAISIGLTRFQSDRDQLLQPVGETP